MKFNRQKSSILDCTLRDGSYVNNFGFNKIQSSKILIELEKATFKISSYHGIGFWYQDRH